MFSNTKVSVFLQFAHALETFREIVRSTPKPNAVNVLECLDTNAGCDLHYASDMLLMLTEGLTRLPNVEARIGTVVEANLDREVTMSNLPILLVVLIPGSPPSGQSRRKIRIVSPQTIFVHASLSCVQARLPR